MAIESARKTCRTGKLDVSCLTTEHIVWSRRYGPLRWVYHACSVPRMGGGRALGIVGRIVVSVYHCRLGGAAIGDGRGKNGGIVRGAAGRIVSDGSAIGDTRSDVIDQVIVSR